MDCCTGALAFDVEYARQLEEHNKKINELRAAVNSHAGDTELRTIIDNATAHFDDIFRLKGIAAKADVFHILSGMWKTPAERCFLWIGGFRSSELLKVSSSFPEQRECCHGAHYVSIFGCLRRLPSEFTGLNFVGVRSMLIIKPCHESSDTNLGVMTK